MSKKKVTRFNLWLNPVFDEMMKRETDVELSIADVQGPFDVASQLLAQAHVYQISAAINELPAPWRVTDDLLKACPQLLCVSSGGAGYDTVDVDACTRAGVLVLNQAGGNARSVAELTLALMLDVSRQVSRSDRLLRTERGFSRESLMGHEISEKTLGIVGLGEVGRRTAALARAFDMVVLACDPLLSAEEIRARGAEPVSLDALVVRSDFVSLHCPHDKTTHNMFDAGRFAAMKTGAIFISTARGGIHDEAALEAALRSGHLAGAGLDVWKVEPPPLDHPLLHLDNVVSTFHTAGVTHEARHQVARMAAEQIIGLFRGQRPPRLINPAAWPLYLERSKRILA